MRLHHIALRSRDVETVASFYQRLFALDRVRVQTDDRGARAVWLGAQDVVVMVERAEEAEPEPPPRGLELVAFDGRDRTVEYWRSHLRERDVTIESSTAFTLYFRDPEGRRVGISTFEFNASSPS